MLVLFTSSITIVVTVPTHFAKFTIAGNKVTEVLVTGLPAKFDLKEGEVAWYSKGSCQESIIPEL